MTQLSLGDRVVVVAKGSFFEGMKGTFVAISHSSHRFGHRVRVDGLTTYQGGPRVVPFASYEIQREESDPCSH